MMMEIHCSIIYTACKYSIRFVDSLLPFRTHRSLLSVGKGIYERFWQHLDTAADLDKHKNL